MMWFTLVLIASMIILYVHDHFFGKKPAEKVNGLPIKGMLVTGILYYLVSEGLLSKDEEKQLENSSLEELEGYVSEKGLMSEGEWSEVCMIQCEAPLDGLVDFDLPI